MKFRFTALAFFAGAFVSLPSVAAPERHIVVVVWDGMRPDFISAETTPNLWRLANEGVFFAHHHPVYLSSTEVNGTAIATGAYPSRSTMISNVDFRPAIDPVKTVATENPDVIRKGDEVTSGHYLGAPTTAEILRAHGLATVISGSKQVALLHDRALRENNPKVSPVLFEGVTLPAELAATLTEAQGAFPPIGEAQEKTARDAWTTKTLIETLWKKELPAFSLLWLAEPDFSQHAAGPGSAQALTAVKSSDTNLGLLLAALDQRGLRANTDVLVVSDHGFSTITRKVDVAVELSKAGFDAKRVTNGGLKKGEVLAVSNGGTTLLYVGHHDRKVVTRVAAFLQQQDWSGVVFSREAIEGTFPLREARIDAPNAPDLAVSLRWMHGLSATQAPGLQTADMAPTSNKVGGHASLSRYDMHNTLVAAGPDFRRGVMNTLPSGNTDIAPTALWLLGLRDEAAKMDGRVLGEALNAPDVPPLNTFDLKRLIAKRAFDAGVWEQYLQVAEVNGVRYLDEGNGDFRKP
jgi:arylsulfatase A-like enzyme